MRPDDIVVGAFPGALTKKTRPAVVLSTEDYHRHRPDVVVGLITTQAPRPLAPTDAVQSRRSRPVISLGCFSSRKPSTVGEMSCSAPLERSMTRDSLTKMNGTGLMVW